MSAHRFQQHVNGHAAMPAHVREAMRRALTLGQPISVQWSPFALAEQLARSLAVGAPFAVGPGTTIALPDLSAALADLESRAPHPRDADTVRSFAWLAALAEFQRACGAAMHGAEGLPVAGVDELAKMRDELVDPPAPHEFHGDAGDDLTCCVAHLDGDKSGCRRCIHCKEFVRPAKVGDPCAARVAPPAPNGHSAPDVP